MTPMYPSFPWLPDRSRIASLGGCKPPSRWLAVLGLGMVLLPASGRAADWPQFRGPAADGVSGEQHLASQWSKDQHIRWQFTDPGLGWSSPIVWGDKVFLTTAVSDKQTKPKPGALDFGGPMGGFGGPGRGGPGRRGPGGFGGPPRPGQILPPFLQERLNLTDEQKQQLQELQKETTTKVEKLLTEEQNKQLKDGRGNFGPGGPGGPGRRGPGGFGGPPQPGQILPPFLQERLNLTADQKKQLQQVQKEVDDKLAKLLTPGQNQQLKEMRQAVGRMGGGRPPDAIYRWEVYCLDAASGKVLWKRVAAENRPRIPKQPNNSYASETPVTDGERVYAYFGMTGLFCYDLDGKLLWSKDLGSYPMMMGQGTGSSPALDGDRLFVQCDNEQQSFLAALDKRTGKELWRVDRAERSSWSTPLVWRNKQRTELVACGSRVRSYDPATGKVLWELGGRDDMGGRGGMGGMGGGPCASPVGTNDLLYVGLGGRMGPRSLFAVRAGASGDLTLKPGETANAGIAWSRAQAGPAMASPLLYQGYLYTLEDRGGMVSCYDARTGTPAYTRQRLPSARGFTASPWASDGKIFCLDEEGQTFVLQAGPVFKLLGKNKLDEMCWASPAVADGRVFLRGVDHLYCIKD